MRRRRERRRRSRRRRRRRRWRSGRWRSGRKERRERRKSKKKGNSVNGTIPKVPNGQTSRSRRAVEEVLGSLVMKKATLAKAVRGLLKA